MLYTIGIVITTFLAVILLAKKDKNYPDKILFAWLCVITIHLTLFALLSTQEYGDFPYLLGLEMPIPLLHGPLLYLYTRALTSQGLSAGKSALHFIPFGLALASLIPFLLQDDARKVFVYQNEGLGYVAQSLIIFLAIVSSGTTYSALSLRALLSHKNRIKENFSYTEKTTLQWLFNLIIGLSCIWILVLFADDEYIFTSVVLYVLFIGYFGIKQVGIFTDQQVIDFSNRKDPSVPLHGETKNAEIVKYERSILTQQQLDHIHTELKGLMSREKLFLTPELTLSMVAERLDVHPNTLSEVINRAEQKSFFDYINTMRIEEFKSKVAMPENQNYTLLFIAHDCGFNSKTSFNRNFKNSTGKSPSEYLKEVDIILR